VAGFPTAAGSRKSTPPFDSDLPIDAYLDKGFDAWLKRSSHYTLALHFALSPRRYTGRKAPTWGELTQEQQQTLAPLAEDWTISNLKRKRKWKSDRQALSEDETDEQARVRDACKRGPSSPPRTPGAPSATRRWKKLPPDKNRVETAIGRSTTVAPSRSGASSVAHRAKPPCAPASSTVSSPAESPRRRPLRRAYKPIA